MSKEKGYSYPLDHTWSVDDIVNVIALFEAVERAYEKGIAREEWMSKYRAFKTVVPGKAEEKQLDKQFEEESGYSLYRVTQAAKENKELIKVRQ
ncbi:MAG: UPF0223 family protein [Bacilli bacterium]